MRILCQNCCQEKTDNLHFRKTDNANISDRMTILLQKTSPLQQENEWGSSIISLFIVETGVPKGTKLKLQLESFDQFF